MYEPPEQQPFGRWPNRCRAVAEDVTDTARCDYRRGHTGDHAAERGMYWLAWSSIVSVL